MGFFNDVANAVTSSSGLAIAFRTVFWTALIVLLGWWTGAFRYIRNSRVGVVEKLWSTRGSVKSGLIALGGEAGYQPDVLRGGLPPLLESVRSPLRFEIVARSGLPAAHRREYARRESDAARARLHRLRGVALSAEAGRRARSRRQEEAQAVSSGIR